MKRPLQPAPKLDQAAELGLELDQLHLLLVQEPLQAQGKKVAIVSLAQPNAVISENSQAAPGQPAA